MYMEARVTPHSHTSSKKATREEHFLHALSMVKLGYWWWDPLTHELEWSEECFHILGLDPANDRASMEDYLEAIHPEDRLYVQQSMQRVMTTNSAPDLEYRIVHADGTQVTVYTRAEMVNDEEGRPLYLFGTLQDITQQKQQEEALQHARQVAESASKAKSAFLSRMSHEFFTPLNAVVGFGHILSEESSLTEETGLMVQEINRAGKRLTDLVKDILTYTHLESANIDMQEIDLAIFMQDIYDAHARTVAEHSQILDLAPVQAITFYSDPTHLKTILHHLLDNAVKYNQSNGRVCIGAEQLNKQTLRIWVQDSGCGIRPEFCGKVYNPFERQPHHDNVINGSGLGLSICKRIGSLLGGEMGYISQVNQGSRFWIELPLTQA